MASRDDTPYYPGQGTGLGGAVKRWQTVVPSNSEELQPVGIGIRNNGPLAAAIRIMDVTGGIETFNMAASHEISTSVRKVFAAGTDSGAQVQVAFDQ